MQMQINYSLTPSLISHVRGFGDIFLELHTNIRRYVMQSKKPTLKQRYNKIVNTAAVVATPVILASAAHAEGLDMTQGTTQLALGLAAVGAIGAAKLAPAALTWVWSLVTGTAKRG